jgi:hypothetical protein
VKIEYQSGKWLALAGPGGGALTESGADPELVGELWRVVQAGGPLADGLEAFTGRPGTTLSAVPPFALVFLDDSGAHVACRGGLAIAVESGGETTVITGVGVASWREERTGVPEAVTVAPVRARGQVSIGSGRTFELVSGMVLAGSLTMAQADRALGGPAGGIGAVPEDGDDAAVAAGAVAAESQPNKSEAASFGESVAPNDPEPSSDPEPSDESRPPVVSGPVSDTEPLGGPELLSGSEPPRDSETQGDSEPADGAEAGPAAQESWAAAVQRLGSAASLPEAPDAPEAASAEPAAAGLASGGIAEELVEDSPAQTMAPGATLVGTFFDVEEPPSHSGAPARVEEENFDHLWDGDTQKGSVESAAVRLAGDDLETEAPGSSTPDQDDAGQDDLDYDHDGMTIAAPKAARHLIQVPRAGEALGGDGVYVLGRVCPCGTANPPRRSACAACGLPLSEDPVAVRRPALGFAVVTPGERYELTRPLILGRKPRSARFDPSNAPILVTVPSPSQDISRSHLGVELEDWSVLVADLGATNGTILRRPGLPDRRLQPKEQVLAKNADVFDLGDGVTLTIEGLP